jgi:hypothetical protein
VGLRRSILTLLIAFALMGVASSLGQVTPAQQRTYRVSGKLVGGPPILSSGFGPVLYSVPQRQPRSQIHGFGRPLLLPGTLKSDGSFEFLNVPAGTYQLGVNPAGAVLRSVATIVVTNGDVTGVEIPLVRTDVVTSRQNLEMAWSLPGSWSGVAPSENGIYATSPDADAVMAMFFVKATMPGYIREIDYDGSIRQEIPLPSFKSMRLAVAHFSGSSKPVFLMYGSFVERNPQPSDVRAFDDQGNLLWAHPSLQAASDIAVLSSGNNSDKVAIGYATGGFSILNSDGQLMWTSITKRKVYHVAAGDVRGEGTPQAISTSEFGRVHIFDLAHGDVASLDPGTQASMVRVGKLSDSDRAATIFAIGAKQTESAATVTSLSGDGNVNWSVHLPSNITPPYIYSSSLASGRPWLAVALQGGQVYVVDGKQGTIIGSIDGQTLLPEVGWIAGKDGAAPRLVVSTETAVNGYSATERR